MDPNLSLQISDAMRGYSIETTPAGAAKIDAFANHVPAGTTVNVTYLAGADPADTLTICRRLADEGMTPVPHVAARNIASADQLDSYLGALAGDAGVREALVIAGGRDRPAGPFDASMALLETGLFEKHGIRRIAVAGHPEGNPDIDAAGLAAALAAKNAWAAARDVEMYLETQFCFEAAPVLTWERQIRAAGNRLPIKIGLPGPATLKTLVKYAQMSGVGPSLRVITRQTRHITKLLTVQAPDRLVAGLAAAITGAPECRLAGFHLYPFGGFAKTAAWANAVVDGAFDLDEAGGFKLRAPLRDAS